MSLTHLFLSREKYSNTNKHRYVPRSRVSTCASPIEKCRVVWYDSVTTSGRVAYQNALTLENKDFFDAAGEILQTIVGEMHVSPCFVHKEQARIVLVVCTWVLTCSDVVRSVEVDTTQHKQSRLHFVRVCPVLCLHLDGSTNRALLISRTVERRLRNEAIDFGPRFERCASRNVCVTLASHPYLLS